MRALYAAVAASLIFVGVACDQPRTAPREPHVTPEPRLEKSIELPGGQETAHILVVPTGFMESARCIVVTGRSASPAVSCLPKDFDLSDDGG